MSLVNLTQRETDRQTDRQTETETERETETLTAQRHTVADVGRLAVSFIVSAAVGSETKLCKTPVFS